MRRDRGSTKTPKVLCIRKKPGNRLSESPTSWSHLEGLPEGPKRRSKRNYPSLYSRLALGVIFQQEQIMTSTRGGGMKNSEPLKAD
jgi:hypothetical protein